METSYRRKTGRVNIVAAPMAGRILTNINIMDSRLATSIHCNSIDSEKCRS